MTETGRSLHFKRLRRDGVEALLGLVLHGREGLVLTVCVPCVDAGLVEVRRSQFKLLLLLHNV